MTAIDDTCGSLKILSDRLLINPGGRCGSLNLVLDLFLVRSCGMGIGGAALATLAAQLLQTALLAYVVQVGVMAV